jgi:ribulose-5-phosphate 4-epimerase/fuculose-1-phosphate aldolase
MSTDNDLPKPSAELVDDLVTANHILFQQRVVDAFGHVSARHDGNPERFLLARNIAPASVTRDDILQYDLDGTPLDANGRRVYLERFIHGAIYRARPDVMAVVHSHSPAVLPFTIARKATLRPVCHMSGFLGAGAPRFEIRDVAGDGSDLLVSNVALGRALATSLGNANFVLMRGHGSTVAAPSLKVAVYRAVYAEVNARLQLDALQLGEPEYLSAGEAEATMTSNEAHVDRPWALWKRAAAATMIRDKKETT